MDRSNDTLSFPNVHFENRVTYCFSYASFFFLIKERRDSLFYLSYSNRLLVSFFKLNHLWDWKPVTNYNDYDKHLLIRDIFLIGFLKLTHLLYTSESLGSGSRMTIYGRPTVFTRCLIDFFPLLWLGIVIITLCNC